MEIKNKILIRFFEGLLALAVILTLVLGVVISGRYRNTMEQYYAKTAFDQAQITASYVDGDRMEGYLSTMDIDDYYEAVSAYLLTIKQTVGLTYLYVVVPLEDGMIYIWDAGEAEEYGICALGDKENYFGEGKEVMLEVFENPNAEDTILITNNSAYGYLASAYVPVLNAAGKPVALAGVDISMDAIDAEIRSFLRLLIMVIAGIVLLFIGIYFFFAKKTMLTPLIDSLIRVTMEKERIGAELDVAKQIQADMLPNIFPAFPDRKEIEIYAAMTPAKEVGGDFYDFFFVDKEHLALVIADVSGKGVPAALFMMISKTLLKNAVQSGCSPKEAFERVNDELCENNQADMFVTVWLGILDVSTGKITCANAGHEFPIFEHAAESPPHIRSAENSGSYELIKDKHGFVLAGMEGAKYTEYELRLKAGERLYLYTDGVPEATNAKDEMYGLDRLLLALNRRGGETGAELLFAIKQDIDTFVNGAAQFDDITMLAIQWKGNANE